MSTSRKKAAFLDALHAGESVSAAAKAAGVSRTRAYEWKGDPSFAVKWDSIVEAHARRHAPLGAARIVAMRDDRGQPVLGPDLEQLFALDVSAVDPTVVARLIGRQQAR